MRERTPSADDTPKRAPPAPPREADVVGTKRLPSLPIEWYRGCGPRMVASTHNLEDLGLNHPTSASDEIRQQQNAQTKSTQDKRSRLSSVIANLRKKVPEQNNPPAGSDSRTSVERNLESLEKYVMTVLNGVINEQQQDEQTSSSSCEQELKVEPPEPKDEASELEMVEPAQPNEAASTQDDDEEEKKSLGEIIMDRLGEPRQDDVRAICWGILNDLVQSLELEPELQPSGLTCSLPLEKVASVLQACQDRPKKSPGPTIRHLCLYCDRKFLSISLRQRHVERVHQTGGRRSERNANKQPQNCQYCSDKCPDGLEALFQHLLRTHKDKYHGCGQCSTRYSTKDALTAHLNDVHAGVVETIQEKPKDTKVMPPAVEVPDVEPAKPLDNPSSSEFDTSFYSNISCNIRENLLHHLDGKLQMESKPVVLEGGSSQAQMPIDISLTAATPVYSKDYVELSPEEFSEHAQKPGKTSHGYPRRVSYEKYNFPRKYDWKEQTNWSSIQDLSKFDISTQITLRKKQQIIKEKALQEEKEEQSEGAEGTSFGDDFGRFLRLKKVSESEEDKSQKPETVFVGEWSKPRIYVCAACASRFITLKELDDHKMAAHPNTWCTHFEFSGDQRELYKHLYLPGRSVPTAKARNALLPEKICTKCAKNCSSLAELHRHMLECAGDQVWLLGLFGNGKKKCKWRPFGSRSRRRRRGMKRNIQNSQTQAQPYQSRGNTPKEKPPAGPRVRPSDRESIQKMLENLPPKRTSKKVLQENNSRTRRNAQSKLRPRMVTDNTKKRTAHKKGSLKQKVLQNEKRMQRKRSQLNNPTAEEPLVTQDEEDKVEQAESLPSRITRESAKQNNKFRINSSGKTKGVRVLATKRSLKFKETANSLRSKGISSTKSSNTCSNPDSKMLRKKRYVINSAGKSVQSRTNSKLKNTSEQGTRIRTRACNFVAMNRRAFTSDTKAAKEENVTEEIEPKLLLETSHPEDEKPSDHFQVPGKISRSSSRISKKIEADKSVKDEEKEKSKKGRKSEDAAAKMKLRKSLESKEKKEENSKSDEEAGVPEDTPAVRPKKSLRKKDVVTPGLRKSLRIVDKKNSEEDADAKAENSTAESSVKVEEVGRRRRSRVKNTEEIATSNEEEETSKDEVANCAEGISETETLLNVAVDKLQQECCQASVDSGKENLSEVPVNVLKPKIMRSKKTKGQKKEIGPKRSLSNVIGILTEGMNIPVEVQDSVVFTVQTSGEVNIETVMENNQTQEVISCESVEIGQEKESSTVDLNSVETEELKTKGVTENSENIELKSKSVEPTEEQPTSDIILDLSRRKQTGKGSFLEKIVSKIVQKKDPHLLNCFSKNVENESLKDKNEVQSRVQLELQSSEVKDEVEDANSKELDISVKESKVEKTLETEEIAEKENSLMKENISELDKSIEEKALKAEINLRVKPSESEETLEKSKEVQIDNQGGKKKLNKRFSDGATSVRNKRKTVPEENKEKEEQDELQLADIMELINQPRETVTPTSSESLFGKRKSIDDEENIKDNQDSKRLKVGPDEESLKPVMNKNETIDKEVSKEPVLMDNVPDVPEILENLKPLKKLPLRKTNSKSKNKSSDENVSEIVPVKGRKGGRKMKKENIEIESEISGNLNSTENDCAGETDDLPKKRTRAVRNKHVKPAVEVSLELNQSEEDNQPKLDTQNQSDFLQQPDVQNKLEDPDQLDVQNQPELQNLESSLIKDQPLEGVPRKRNAPKKKPTKTESKRTSRKKSLKDEHLELKESSILDENLVKEDLCLNPSFNSDETLQNSISIDPSINIVTSTPVEKKETMKRNEKKKSLLDEHLDLPEIDSAVSVAKESLSLNSNTQPIRKRRSAPKRKVASDCTPETVVPIKADLIPTEASLETLNLSSDLPKEEETPKILAKKKRNKKVSDLEPSKQENLAGEKETAVDQGKKSGKKTSLIDEHLDLNCSQVTSIECKEHEEPVKKKRSSSRKKVEGTVELSQSLPESIQLRDSTLESSISAAAIVKDLDVNFETITVAKGKAKRNSSKKKTPEMIVPIQKSESTEDKSVEASSDLKIPQPKKGSKKKSLLDEHLDLSQSAELDKDKNKAEAISTTESLTEVCEKIPDPEVAAEAKKKVSKKKSLVDEHMKLNISPVETQEQNVTTEQVVTKISEDKTADEEVVLNKSHQEILQEVLLLEKKKKVTKEAPKFFCEYCACSFTRKSSLKKHNQSQSHILQLSAGAKLKIVEEKKDEKKAEVEEEAEKVKESPDVAKEDVEAASESKSQDDEVDFSESFLPSENKQSLEDLLLDEEICKITENMSHDEYVLTDHISPDPAQDLKADKFSKPQKKARSKKVAKKTTKKKRNLAEEHLELNSPKKEESSEVSLTAETVLQVQEEMKKEEKQKEEEDKKIIEVEEPQIVQENVRPKRKTYRQSYRESDHELDLDFALGEEAKQKVKSKKPKSDPSPSKEISKSESFQNLLESPSPELKVDVKVGAEFDSSDNSLDTNMSADIQKIIDDPKLTDEETKSQNKSGSCKKDKKKTKSPRKKKSSDVSDSEDKVEVKSKRKIVTSVFARALAADKVEKMKEFLDDWDSNEEDVLEQNNKPGLSENEEVNKIVDEGSSPRCRQSKKRAEERISKSFEEDFEPKIETVKVSEPPVVQAEQPEEDEDDDDGISCRDMSPIFAYNTLDSSMESNSFVSREEEKNVEDSSKSEFSGEKIVIRSQDRTEVVTIAPTDAIEDNALDVPQNKMRQGKVLNFDEELFVECCSRLKATSEKELRGAKKIKLDQSEGYHRKDEQQIRERDRWRDADSQNSLGSLLESVNQLLGEDISSNREQDYKKRSQKPVSAWSSRSASPDASRPDNIGYEDSLDVAFEHNNKLRDKIQQRMRESESLLVNTYGQKDTNQEFHKSSSFSFEINSSPGRVRSLDKTISNLLHNGKPDHNGSNPMKVLAELACARVPNSMPEPLTPQKSPIIRESLFTSDIAKDRKSRNPIKELFERKKEINERKEQTKVTPKIETEGQKKLKKVKKTDFPLIKTSQRGGLSEKKKRKEAYEKHEFGKEKDVYDFDDEEIQVSSSFSSGLSYRNKNGDSVKVKEASEMVVRSQEGEKFAPKTKGALKCFQPEESKEESLKVVDAGPKQAMRKKTSNSQNRNQKSKKKPKMLKRKGRNSWYENDSSDEFITAVKAEEEVGVGISKSQRNCSKGKQNLFAELSTSCESEFEDRKSPVIVNQPEEKEMEKESWQSVLKKADSEFSDRSLVIDENKIEDDNKSDDENDYQRNYELDDFRENSSMESSDENEKTNGFESDEKSVRNESAKSVTSNSTKSNLRSPFSDENSDRDEKEDEDEEDDETVNLPEKLSSNEKPEPKSDNLPLHVFLSRKVQESKKRKEEQEQKRLEEEQMKILEGIQLSRKPRKCAIGKQGLLAEFSSSDEDFSERTPRRKRESKETKKERYLEKQREKRFANEQKAIEEMILRDVKSKKEQGKDEKDEKAQTEISENEKSFEERDSSTEKKKQLQDVSKEENGKKEHRKVEKAKVENKGEKKKVAVNNEKSKSKSLPTPKEKDRRPDGRKRESDDEELSTTKYWNRVEEGVGVAIGRRKRAAVNQLYYWSSSSDDEDLTSSIVPLEVEADDERQEQHGWIVGDSHKRMITMLAMEKRRRSEDEHETKPKKHRNGLS